MKTTIQLTQLLESTRSTLGYKVEGAILEFTEQITGRLQVLGLSRSKLAQRLKTSPAYVTKCLAGDTNFTLESMVKMANALESDIRITVVPRVATTAWIDVLEKAASGPSTRCAVQHHWKLRTQADETSRLIGCVPPHAAEIDWLRGRP